MDISRVSDSLSNATSRALSPVDLFRQITQLGSIEARVALIEKGQALLNTRLGQILSNNTLDLKQGDRLSLRAGGSEQSPVLKIVKLPVQPFSLSGTRNPLLNQAIPSGKAGSALVTGHQSGKTIIQLANQKISIQPAVDLKPGQLISLIKTASGQNIELRPIDHQQVLKSALSQLLPQQASAQQSTALTQLIRLIQTLTSAEPSKPAGVNQAVTPTATFQSANQLTATVNQPIPVASNQSSAKPVDLVSQLANLLSTLPQLSNLDKPTIQRWVSYFIATSQSREPATSPQNPYQLLQQMAKSEGRIDQQLPQHQQGFNQSNQTAKTDEARPNLEASLLNSGKELVKLVEQSVSQQLLQQTSLRLQQELQQPIAFNLAIPLTDQQKNQELRLKIRQRKNESDPDRQSWDIHLDFEFGLLGMISTHLLLDDNTLSASFWSEQLETQQKIDRNLDSFKQQISRVGYDPGQFHSFPGKPPASTERETSHMPDSLLDIRV